jgi:osmoprotectant transport system permease protein
MKWLMLVLALAAPLGAQQVIVGSKSFNESVVLGEVITELARQSGASVTHKSGMGGTGVVWKALLAGEIDVYVDYTGTILKETYANLAPADMAAAQKLLERDGIVLGPALGFNNTYAIGMKEAEASRLGVVRVSDLVRQPGLAFAFGNEFMDRADGWPGLKAAYGLPQSDVRGMEHSLAYQALEAGRISATDLYSTDAEIEQLKLRVLEDDKGYFPEYKAVILYRADLAKRAPKVVEAWRRLEHRINEPVMVGMNAAVLVEKRSEAETARRFVHEVLPRLEGGEQGRAEMVRTEGERTLGERLGDSMARLPRLTLEHLGLVFASLLAGILIAVPLGVLAHRRRRLGQAVLGVAGVLQTIPSIALLVLLIPLVGIGWWPAVIALFLYSLLPILRNTHAGLAGIPGALIESADALGLSRSARLRLIELPLAARSILAGVKTAAVINVGTAALGGFIGAGGYGEAIFSGIRRQDNVQILEGAVPAALLAILLQVLFEIAERAAIPRGLRQASAL